ncbi:hypothetical protein [Streptosporangium amethystogenes]|uniref:hypothetical protein n=1 Tax=Streptosporangium amethystogenes TaxID=2002 RepID=UPI0004CC60EA|nr:hypothetical protein [Streptosporangium amethystogenes]
MDGEVDAGGAADGADADSSVPPQAASGIRTITSSTEIRPFIINLDITAKAIAVYEQLELPRFS